MELFDAHCHLQDERIFSRADSLLDRAAAAGVRYWMCCGSSPDDWEDVARLSDRRAGVRASFGVHPWYTKGLPDNWLDLLEKQLGNDRRAACVGEIGLDHALNPRNDELQADIFVKQLRLARDLARPVSIHCRKAWKALIDILEQEGGLPHGGVIHSYSGSRELVSVLENLGCYISFSGSLTRPANRKARSACLSVSRDRLLIETDAPDILPQGKTGPDNLPEYLPSVLETLAELRGDDMHALGKQTTVNALRIFGG